MAMALLACMLFAIVGCKVTYSFTGASISPDVKTVSVANFINLAPIINPTLASNLTEKLKEHFMRQSRLQLVDRDGDLQFSGEILGYSINPTAIQGNETAAVNRFTISVHVVFVNKKDEKANYDQEFSAFEDYSANTQFNDVEEKLTNEIIEQLIEKIFNAAVANW